MKNIETTIRLQAAPEDVWRVLTDFASYPEWNPFIKSIEGNLQEGEQLTVVIQPPGAGAMTFKPTILKLEQNVELRWLGTLLFKGLFDGEHYFLIDQNEDGSTRFVQGENFSGLLVPLFPGTLEKTKKGFEKMHEAIQKHLTKPRANP